MKKRKQQKRAAKQKKAVQKSVSKPIAIPPVPVQPMAPKPTTPKPRPKPVPPKPLPKPIPRVIKMGNIPVINVKDLNAVGDGIADDTDAIQAAIEEATGSSDHPHGRNYYQNIPLYFPPGHYKISKTLNFTAPMGAWVFGSGRFTTTITQSTPAIPAFSTNGCSFSLFENMCIEAASAGCCFNLDWDGTNNGGDALQSNIFSSMFFSGGDQGLLIGAGGHMGSETLVEQCFFINQTDAGIRTMNFNALDNTVIGGDFQSCNVGIKASVGAIETIHGVSFQGNGWDIQLLASANDTSHVAGCRTESGNFIQACNGVSLVVQGCSQLGSSGIFISTFYPSTTPVVIDGCVSLAGQVVVGGDHYAQYSIRNSAFGRTDWLNIGGWVDANQTIELESVTIGAVPNGNQANKQFIKKQRISSAGTQNYVVS